MTITISGVLFATLGALVTGFLGALGFRMAGGLMSQWAGRDLGDFLPRQVWGMLATLPVCFSLIHTSYPAWLCALIIVGCSICTGLLRGIGWGNSMSFGYFKVGHPTSDTINQTLTMTWRIGVMTILPVICAVALAPTPRRIGLAVVLFLIGLFSTIYSSLEEWQKGGYNIPRFGCSPNDPHTSNELVIGMNACITVAGLAIW